MNATSTSGPGPVMSDEDDYDEHEPPEHRGECVGVSLEARDGDLDGTDQHAIVVLLAEDDGRWFRRFDFSSHWLDEAIEKLTEARERLRRSAKRDPEGFGWLMPTPEPTSKDPP